MVSQACLVHSRTKTSGRRMENGTCFLGGRSRRGTSLARCPPSGQLREGASQALRRKLRWVALTTSVRAGLGATRVRPIRGLRIPSLGRKNSPGAKAIGLRLPGQAWHQV